MKPLELTLAVGDYDHTRDVAHGVVRAEAIALRWLGLPVEEIFYRFIKYREWDISEMSFGKFAAFMASDDQRFVAIPVFPSRVFRLSSFYVSTRGRIRSADDLAGARIGIPEWGQTASIYTRGYIAHELAVPLTEIEWVQAGVNQAGRVEKTQFTFPQGVRYRSEPAHTLDEMLQAGAIDVALTARPPRSFSEGSDTVTRLFPDFRAREDAYFRKTGVFPIMHVLAMKREVYEAHPWIAMNLMKAFEEAKTRSLARLSDITASHVPLPWIPDYLGFVRELMGDDPWPYGIEPNRKTLEAFLTFAFEQGICQRRLDPADLFVPEVQTTFKV
jgi:4,5-dihydroxyphthalate decarboxylase